MNLSVVFFGGAVSESAASRSILWKPMAIRTCLCEFRRCSAIGKGPFVVLSYYTARSGRMRHSLAGIVPDVWHGAPRFAAGRLWGGGPACRRRCGALDPAAGLVGGIRAESDQRELRFFAEKSGGDKSVPLLIAGGIEAEHQADRGRAFLRPAIVKLGETGVDGRSFADLEEGIGGRPVGEVCGDLRRDGAG